MSKAKSAKTEPILLAKSRFGPSVLKPWYSQHNRKTVVFGLFSSELITIRHKSYALSRGKYIYN
jgi:hypothetical protein